MLVVLSVQLFAVSLSIINHKKMTLIIWNGNKYNLKNSCNFLSIVIDDNISWHPHIASVCSKVSKGICLLRALDNISVDREILLRPYYGVICTIVSYGITVWGPAGKTLANRIFVWQKRVVCIIYNLGSQKLLGKIDYWHFIHCMSWIQ